MKYYKLIYPDGKKCYAIAKNDLDLVQTFDLTSKKNVKTKVEQITDPIEIACIRLGDIPK